MLTIWYRWHAELPENAIYKLSLLNLHVLNEIMT